MKLSREQQIIAFIAVITTAIGIVTNWATSSVPIYLQEHPLLPWLVLLGLVVLFVIVSWYTPSGSAKHSLDDINHRLNDLREILNMDPGFENTENCRRYVKKIGMVYYLDKTQKLLGSL